MRTIERKVYFAGALLLMTASAQALQPEVLYAFQLGPRNPQASLVQGNDGHFYGTTSSGGSSNKGTVFRVTPNGVLTTLASFDGANGSDPFAGLVLGRDGNLYGTTRHGGRSYGGTVFMVTTNGGLTTLVSFNGANGAYPTAELLLGTDGNFYGTTAYGGSSATDALTGSGTVFKVTTNGVLTSLVSFNDTNGANPQAGLVLDRDGNSYGTTSRGGSSGNGTVFQMTANGVLTSLALLADLNGAHPEAGLVLGRDEESNP